LVRRSRVKVRKFNAENNAEKELEELLWEEHLRYLKLHKEHEKEIKYIG